MLMKTMQVTTFGGPEVLEPRDAPVPVPAAGEALVAVEIADVIVLDATLRSGSAQDWFDLRPPYVPGGGVAGRVVAVGDAQDARWVGRRVAARLGQAGGLAGCAVAPVTALVAIPDGVSTIDAGALVHDGLTAMGLLERLGVRAGERVLVTAAAGGMGVLLLQLLLAIGATVVGAVRGREKQAVVEALGAVAADYDAEAWAAAARDAAGGPFDAVLDGVGGGVGAAAFAVTAAGGRFSAHGAASGDFAAVGTEGGITVLGIRDVWFTPHDARRLTLRAFSEVAQGRLLPLVTRPLPLHRAVEAHRAIDERRASGKAVVLLAPPAGARPAVRIAGEVLTWPGTDAAWGTRAEHALTFEGRELGHLHGDRVAHFSFPRELGAELRAARVVGPHPVNPHSMRLAAREIRDDGDVDDVLALLRRNYDREAARGIAATA